MTEKRFTLTFDDKIIDNLTGIIHDVHSGYDVAMDLSGLLNVLNDENEQLKQQLKTRVIVNKQYEELQRLKKENEQLKFKLEEVRSDEKQLGISFMEFKMKLIEKLQIHYDYATEQRQKNLNDIFVAKAYDIIRYDIKKLAEEMGVDFE